MHNEKQAKFDLLLKIKIVAQKINDCKSLIFNDKNHAGVLCILMEQRSGAALRLSRG